MPTFPFGAHLAVVKVDTETSKTVLRRLVALTTPACSSTRCCPRDRCTMHCPRGGTGAVGDDWGCHPALLDSNGPYELDLAESDALDPGVGTARPLASGCSIASPRSRADVLPASVAADRRGDSARDKQSGRRPVIRLAPSTGTPVDVRPTFVSLLGAGGRFGDGHAVINARTARATRSGCSSGRKCPHGSTSVRRSTAQVCQIWSGLNGSAVSPGSCHIARTGMGSR